MERNQSLSRALRERAEAVKRGVWQAGGFPVEIPAFSITETYMKPSPMLYRNLLAMETEELLRSLPVDGAVLMGGCDKTTPGLMMGAISMNMPAIYLPAGPMLRGNYQGQALGSGTDLWKFWTERCAGNITEEEWNDMEACIARSPGLLHDHGHRLDHGFARGGAGHDAAGRVVHSRAGFQPRADVDGLRTPHRRIWFGKISSRAIFSRAKRLRTPSLSIWRSAARPTPSFTWWRWPRAAESSWNSRLSTGFRSTFRCSRTCGLRARI